MASSAWTPVDESIRVQDEQGTVHVFPKGSTPGMIAKALNVKPPAGWTPVDEGRSDWFDANAPSPGADDFHAEISAHKGGLGAWLRDLESDVRYGGGLTAPGRLLQKMGAQGLNIGSQAQAGDFMGSPILGPTHVAQGVAQLPSQPWQGTKKIVGGALEMAQIPSGFMAPEAAEAASGLPGKAASGVARLFPSFERAGAALTDAEKAAGSLPIKVTDKLSEAASAIFDSKDFGSQAPRAAQLLYRRLTNPDLPELTYSEARKFYSNISRLSADELGRMNANTKRLMGALKEALNDSIAQTADEAGVGQQYQQGMAGYRSAAQFAERKAQASSLVKKAAIAGAVGIPGGIAVKYGMKLYDLLQ